MTDYEKGANDAFMLLRGALCYPKWLIEDVFKDVSNVEDLIVTKDGSEALKMLSDYEEKQISGGEILLGDEVVDMSGNCSVVFEIGNTHVRTFSEDLYIEKHPKQAVRRTGRNFEGVAKWLNMIMDEQNGYGEEQRG